ncbi:MAG: LD-carboxypeptidase [Oscillospiraceae bacterium]|nr:LD-carboxypeptidase [Oscillospiraceae bacterium]
MIMPKPLFPGARVALIGPASAVPEEKLQPALDFVRSLGLEPVTYPSCYFKNRDGYFAASDRQRAGELNQAFADDSIDGIWCIRGGYGSHRLQPLLDAELIRKNPKWFGGYSDVTALHLFLNQVCGMEAYHCPMPSTEASSDEFTLGWLKKALFGELSGVLGEPDGHPGEMLVPGTTSGILCGGNLSLLAASLGSPWEIDTKDKILFMEDIGEKPYRIDGMLTSLRNAGKFDDCKGIILGAWTDCTADGPGGLELADIFDQLIVPAGKPAVINLACGHCMPTLSLPMGRMCTVDASAGTVTLNV